MKHTNLKKIAALGAALTLTTLLGSSNILYAQSTAATETDTVAAAGAAPLADTEKPSDVEGLKATAGDNEVLLRWQAATDNEEVTGYKIFRGTLPVKSAEAEYNLPMIPIGKVTSYVVKNLTNKQEYFFSAIAVDAAGNESANYALEVSATPKSGLQLEVPADDGSPPQVEEVKAEDVITVLVTFSEPVKLPDEQPGSAFRIEKNDGTGSLAVQEAEIDARDESGKTVLLTTAPQEANAEYVLTVGIELQDLSGNPMISGTLDTGSFKGNDKKKERAAAEEPKTPAPETLAETPKDTQGPILTAGSADFSDRMMITFSEDVTLPENPKSHFSIMRKGTQEILKVVNVSLSVDKKTAYLSTEAQNAVEYEVKVTDVKDLAGNMILETANTIVVTGKGASLEDLVPPEDVTKLVARLKDAQTNIVELQWEASINSAGDLADQSFFQSNDKRGRAYGEPTSLGATATKAQVEDLTPGKWYTFKITAKDTSGNESKGEQTSIFLPQTGPGVFAAGLTAMVMGWWRKRKK